MSSTSCDSVTSSDAVPDPDTLKRVLEASGIQACMVVIVQYLEVLVFQQT